MDEFTVSSSHDGSVAIVRVSGDVDAATAPLVDAEIRTLDGLPLEEVVVDFSEVAFVDSSGLSVLVAALKRLRSTDTRLVVENPNPMTLRLFEIAGLDTLLTIR